VMPVPVELLRFFDRTAQPTPPGQLVEDTGDAEVAAAEAAIENKPAPPAAAAIGQDEQLAIPPGAKIPESPIAAAGVPDTQIPEHVIPEPVVPEPVIPEPELRDTPEPGHSDTRVPGARVPGARDGDPAGNGAGEQDGSGGSGALSPAPGPPPA